MRDAVDARLTRAFRDVAVPEGLAERLAAALAAERPRPRSRRWLLIGGGLAAAAATILLAIRLGDGNAVSVSEESARNEAIRLFDQGNDQRAYSLADRNPPFNYPFSLCVRSVRGTKWRCLNDFLGCRGVVYDLPGPAGVRAALYVVACDATEGLGQSPATPQNVFTSAGSGCCASAWQEGGLLYVLVVQGDPSAYGRYLHLPSSPVA